MIEMEEKIVKYIRKHTMFITVLVLAGFILLASGEYLLYRKVMYVNKMVSEGLMQIKESVKAPTPTVIVPMMKQVK